MRPTPGNDLILGQLAGRNTTLGFSRTERDKHLYVCGGTGTGKSKFLENLIRQDIRSWRKSKCGMIVLDPHGSLFDSLINWLAWNERNIDAPIIPIDLRRDDWIVSYNLLRQRDTADPAVLVDITAEMQKGHTYYRCTKKSRTQTCSQKQYVREEELDRQLSTLLAPYSLRSEWADEMLKMAEQEKEGADHSSAALVQEAQLEMANVKTSLNRLVSIYVSTDNDIEREEFLAQKDILLAKKKQLQESIRENENGQMPWLEPFTEWLNTAKTVGEIALRGSPQEKKIVASKVFGSNLFLDSKKARGCSLKPWSLIPENQSLSNLVPTEGVEPTHSCEYQILSLARLPIPPHRPPRTANIFQRRAK
jgi:hypothetical protein